MMSLVKVNSPRWDILVRNSSNAYELSFFSSLYKLPQAMLGRFQFPLIATEGSQRIALHKIKQSRGSLAHSGGKVMVKEATW